MLQHSSDQTPVRLTAAERKKSERYMFWKDHGILRTFWTNFAKVADGVWRSNYPSFARLKKHRDEGVSSVLTLRGKFKNHHYLLEADSCDRLGLDLHPVALSARKAPPAKLLLQVFEIFDKIQKPFLIHCKSGADRAGLVSALYLLDQGSTVTEARRQLSFRFLHIRLSQTGVLDHILDLYEARLRHGPIGIREWIAQEYDAEAVQNSFSKIRTLPI